MKFLWCFSKMNIMHGEIRINQDWSYIIILVALPPSYFLYIDTMLLQNFFIKKSDPFSKLNIEMCVTLLNSIFLRKRFNNFWLLKRLIRLNWNKLYKERQYVIFVALSSKLIVQLIISLFRHMKEKKLYFFIW